MHLSIRNIQAINMFVSSLSLVFLALGILVNDWVKINIDARTNVKSHSPWAPSTIWSKGKNDTLGRVQREGSSFLDSRLPASSLLSGAISSCCSGPTCIINTVKAEFKNLAISHVLEMFGLDG